MPVSRVLSRAIIPLGGQLLARSRGLPAHLPAGDGYMMSLFGLAPGGVYTALAVTSKAVRSYRTFSPLPEGGLFSAALSLRLPWPGVTRHLALWCPDFPRDYISRDSPAYCYGVYIGLFQTFCKFSGLINAASFGVAGQKFWSCGQSAGFP